MCYGFHSHQDTTRLNIYGRTAPNLEVSRLHDESERLSQKLAFIFVPTIILLCHPARMASRTETWLVSLSVQTDIQHLSNC